MKEKLGDSVAVPFAASRRRVRRIRGDTVLAVLVLSPSLIAVAVFIYAFILWTGYISLTRWNDVLPDYTFVGLLNFERLFSNDRFLIDLGNTALFTVLFLVESIVAGFLLAVFLDQKVRGEPFLNTVLAGTA